MESRPLTAWKMLKSRSSRVLKKAVLCFPSRLVYSPTAFTASRRPAKAPVRRRDRASLASSTGEWRWKVGIGEAPRVMGVGDGVAAPLAGCPRESRRVFAVSTQALLTHHGAKAAQLIPSLKEGGDVVSQGFKRPLLQVVGHSRVLCCCLPGGKVDGVRPSIVVHFSQACREQRRVHQCMSWISPLSMEGQGGL